MAWEKVKLLVRLLEPAVILLLGGQSIGHNNYGEKLYCRHDHLMWEHHSRLGSEVNRPSQSFPQNVEPDIYMDEFKLIYDIYMVICQISKIINRISVKRKNKCQIDGSRRECGLVEQKFQDLKNQKDWIHSCEYERYWVILRKPATAGYDNSADPK